MHSRFICKDISPLGRGDLHKQMRTVLLGEHHQHLAVSIQVENVLNVLTREVLLLRLSCLTGRHTRRELLVPAIFQFDTFEFFSEVDSQKEVGIDT